LKVSQKHTAKFDGESEEKIAKHSLLTLDPFNVEVLHPDVHYLIMQHFTGKALLELSEVSPSWCRKVDGKVVEKVELQLV
jgi:hypothetical protein